MSIISSILADANNEWKDELVKKLEKALEPVTIPENVQLIDYINAINNVKNVLIYLKGFYFEE